MFGSFLRGFMPKGVKNAPYGVRHFRGTLSSMDSKKVHVTFCENKRTLSFSEDDKVSSLRYDFLRLFSDVLTEDIAVANVTFQKYESAFQEFVDVENDVKLDDNSKIKVVITPKLKNQVSSCGGDSALVAIPWYNILTSQPIDVKYHPIKNNISYRLWSLASGGLIQRSPENPSAVTCSGVFGDPNTVLTTRYYGSHLFYLAFADPNGQVKDLYLTAKEKNDQITLSPTQSGATLFEPNYYYGFTMFRSDQWHSLYLGCDDNKLATLVPMEDVNYPNPQALFTVNKYKVDLPVID
ncbi:uncharacterized protein [Montipora foliosa]|uniref:uncharacterized protein n=1 Tax=Montipora foliosa TaxID=591990 RepID=UPI0035F1FCC8